MNITKDKVVSFTFHLKDEENNIIDKRAEPTHYLHGYQHILPLIEQGLEGKTVGDKVKIPIPPEQAYGMPEEKLIRTLPANQFPSVENLQVGMKVYPNDKHHLVMKIIKIEGEHITVDANHPLAGQTLNFEVTVLNVRDATQDEIQSQKVTVQN